MSKFVRMVNNALYPLKFKCEVCKCEMIKDAYICDKCFSKLKFITTNACKFCGKRVVGEGDVCIQCKGVSRDYDRAISAFEYDGEIPNLVLLFKFNNKRYLKHMMSHYMLVKLMSSSLDFDAITYVPSSKKVIKDRGYNVAELLAFEIASKTGKPLISSLEKIKNTAPQKRLSKKNRALNLKESIAKSSDCPNLKQYRSLLLVDDILTTGATANACSAVLKKNNNLTVNVLTFATTQLDRKTKKNKFDFLSAFSVKNAIKLLKDKIRLLKTKK